MGKYLLGMLKAAFMATFCIVGIIILISLIILFPFVAVVLVLMFLWGSLVAIFFEEDKINEELRKDKQRRG